MEGNRNKPRALLVFGAPCSGKTTFSTKFANKFGLAYYDFDELFNSGFTRKNLLTILELLTRTKQTLIIEGGLNTEAQRSEIRNLLRQNGYEPSLVWIQTDTSTIRKRLKLRFKDIAKARETYEKAVKEIDEPTETERPIILSGKHTFETQTRHVVTGLAELNDAK